MGKKMFDCATRKPFLLAAIHHSAPDAFTLVQQLTRYGGFSAIDGHQTFALSQSARTRP